MGVQNEIIINKPSDLTQINFMFHIENAIPEQMEGGYVLLQNNDQIMGIVQAPILTDSSKSANVSIHNTISIEPMGDSWFEFTVYLDQDFLENKNIHYPLRLSLPVELRRDKQPDTPIYSSRPDSNQYLSNVTELGKGKLGTGKSYIRFVLANLFQIDPSRIQSVKYYTYSLNPINADIYLYEVLEDWCSLTTTWNTPIKVGEAIAKTNGLHSGEQVFDITTQAKKWFSDPESYVRKIWRDDASEYASREVGCFAIQ